MFYYIQDHLCRLVILSFLVIIQYFPNITFAQEIQEPADSTKQVIVAIPIIEIPQEAFKTMREIQGVMIPVVTDPVLSEVHPDLDSLQHKIDQLSDITESLLLESLPYTFYQSLLIKWSRLARDIDEPEKKLKDHSVAMEEIANWINSETERWDKTKKKLEDKNAPEDIYERIDEITILIESTNQIRVDSTSEVLHLLNEIAQMKLQISHYTARLDVTKQMQLYDLLTVRSNPIWAIRFDSDSTRAFTLNEALLEFGIDDSREYLVSNKGSFIELGIIFLMILTVLIWLKRQHKKLSEDLKLEHATGVFIVSRPFVSAIMLALLWAIWAIPEMPHFLDNLVSLLFLIPFLFIFHGVVQKPLRSSLYYFSAIFLVVNLSPFFYIGAATSRIALLIESLFIAGFLFWFLWKRKMISTEDKASGFWYRFLNFISPIYLLVIVAAIGANLIGYENLNKLVTYGILVSLLLGLIFGTAYFALRGLILLFTATTLIKISNIIKNDQFRFLLYVDRILWVGTVVAWFHFTLRSFQVSDPIQKWTKNIWETGYEFGNIHITVGGIINFFLIIILSWLLSKLIRVLLQDEILRRFNLPRGIPMAISSLTQYSLVFIGCILALAYAGFDLQNLGIMAGALGVGIGFGLQNVIGNFISGLILVFERPVTVGDIVKLEPYEGTVVSIGIRSSVIRQWDGSRIIVPNSDLISNKVLNWTMTDYKRRFIIRVYTAPDTDPDLVILLMTEAAVNEELVLEDPTPQTYFIGIVEQAHAFDLFFWVSNEILVARSNVNLAVQKKLKAAGIKVLLPKKFEIQEPAEKRKPAITQAQKAKASSGNLKQPPAKNA